MKILFVLLTALISTSSFADELPPPQELLRQASQSREEFFSAVEDTQRLAGTISTPEQAYGYLLILDDLDELGANFRAREFGGDTVRDLGWILTRHSARWIHFGTDGAGVLNAFLKWAEDNTRFDVLEQQYYYLKQSENEKEHLYAWFDNLVNAKEMLSELRAAPFVVAGYSRLSANVTKVLLLNNELASSEVVALIRGATDLSSLLEIADYLRTSVQNKGSMDALKAIMQYTVIFAEQLEDVPLVLPTHLSELPGEILSEGIVKITYGGSFIDPEIAPQMITYLESKQLLSLAERLYSYRLDIAGRDQVDFLWVTVNKIKERLLASGNIEGAPKLDVLISRLAGKKFLEFNRLEGRYRTDLHIETTRGRKGVAKASITLVNTGGGNYLFSVHHNDIVAPALWWDYSLLHVSYNTENEVFEAHHLRSDDPEFNVPNNPTYHSRFIFEKRGDETCIKGWFSNGIYRSEINGCRDQMFQLFNEKPDAAIKDPTGVYVGKRNDGTPAKLIVSLVGTRPTATLLHGYSFGFQDHYNYGIYDQTTNTILLSSGDNSMVSANQAIYHLRGKFEGDTFVAEYIRGGWGIQFTFRLNKIDEN